MRISKWKSTKKDKKNNYEANRHTFHIWDNQLDAQPELQGKTWKA